MKINTRFNIGQEVFAVAKEGHDLIVSRGKVEEILIKSDGSIFYYLDTPCGDFEENKMAHVNDKDRLYKLIKRLSLEGEDDGREIN